MVHAHLESWGVISLHGRTYRLPTAPVVVVCVDGFDPSYLQRGIDDGIMPNLASFVKSGFHQTAQCVMPSFTNPNNVSIITGAPTAVHGIAGNFYLDRETLEERMVVDDTLLRGDTLLQLLARRGVRIAAVTAKDKLRRILSHGLFENPVEDGNSNGNICFSAEKAGSCTLAENGIANVEAWLGSPAPAQYSGELSLYVLDAGIKLLQERRSDVLYLTLSDYVQHKHAPGEKESDAFFSALDARLGELARLASVVGITGDHGMSNKHDGESANVLFLQDELEKAFGAGSARVICPITDPFVRHHGALGSFVRVYARSPELVQPMMDLCAKVMPQVQLVLAGNEAAARFEMPADLEGDFVVVAVKNAVIGSKREEHDLESLRGHPLRSHGGLSEQDVPLIMSRPCVEGMKANKQGSWKNYDIFDLVLNGAA
ncbi:alkaline-phosphatase-like protein [Xylaria sp. CBS 124048]|nr:alkaline-phosphatase-like protein [Xylaria sp. CBS 124048]